MTVSITPTGIFVVGRVDSGNVGELESALPMPFDGRPIDLGGLEYTSSAGLRVLLRLAKQIAPKRLRLKNVERDVYDILDTAGFTDIMDVERALRLVSTQGLKQIGSGYSADVFALDNDTVMKAFRSFVTLEKAREEQRKARVVFQMGVPTVIPLELVRTDKGYGMLFEMMKAGSVAGDIKNGGSYAEHMVPYWRFMRAVNSIEDAECCLPSVKEMCLRDIRCFVADDERFRHYEAMLSFIPDTRTVVHGDFHPANVMVMDDAYYLIDIMSMGHGHPLFEICNAASSCVRYYDIYTECGLAREQMTDKMLKSCYGTTDLNGIHAFFDRGLEAYAPAIKALTPTERLEVDEMLDCLTRILYVQKNEGLKKSREYLQMYKENLEASFEAALFAKQDRFKQLVERYEHLFR